MDEPGLRKAQILHWIRCLFSGSNEEREAAFESLCTFFQDRDIEDIHEELAKRRDTQGIWWLVRYLVEVECKRGFEKLFDLALSENDAIREEACLGIQKISPDAQADLCLRMLDFPYDDVTRFAIRTVGRLRRPKAVIPLLMKMKQVTQRKQDEKILMEIIKALGLLRDPRSLRPLEMLAEQSEGDVREEVLASLGRFASTLHPRFLRSCLASENARVREITFLTLLRLRRRRWEGAIAEALLRERDERLKVLILSAIQELRSRRFFSVVFSLASEDASPRVRMMASSALKRLQSRRMLRWLLDEGRRKSSTVEEIVLRILAAHAKEPAVFEVFRDRYLHAATDRVRLLALESMGALEDRRAVPFLLSVVRENCPFSHAAAVALTHRLDDRDWDIVEEMLSLPEESHALRIQVFSKFVIRLPGRAEIPDSVKKKIDLLVLSMHAPIRHLAVRCLGKVGGRAVLKRLFVMTGTDPDRGVREAAFQETVRILHEEPLLVLDLLTADFSIEELYPVQKRLVDSMRVHDTETFKALLKELVRIVAGARSGDLPFKAYAENCFMSYLTSHVLKAQAAFLDLLRGEVWTDGERGVLMEVLNTTDLYDLKAQSFDFMAEQYRTASEKTRMQFLNFFAKLPSPGQPVEKAVFESMAVEENTALRDRMGLVVSKWFRELALHE